LAVDENALVGTSVGTVTGQDVDAGEAFTYTLLDSAGGRFAINNAGQITVANGTLLDRESAASHTIRVQVTDASGASFEKDFVIGINDVNEFAITLPIDNDPSANSVAEDATIGTAVGITALASDADATTNTVTYTLDDDAGGLFAIDISSGVVTVSGALDYETRTSHAIIVRATSADGSHKTTTFIVNVTNVNEHAVGPISDVSASANYVLENAAPGTNVGITAFASDLDATDKVTYSLDNDTGGRFSINANSGVVSTLQSLNYEESTQYAITVRASSSDGSFRLANFVIVVGDVNEQPIAKNDTYATSYINKLIISAPGVLANDSDPDGNALSVVLLSLPSSGALTINPDGSFTYKPLAGYVGNVSFTYAVTDGLLQSTSATVTIAVGIPTNVPAPNAGGTESNNQSSSSSSSNSTNQATSNTPATSSNGATESPTNAGPIAGGIAGLIGEDGMNNSSADAADNATDSNPGQTERRLSGFRIETDMSYSSTNDGFMTWTSNVLQTMNLRGNEVDENSGKRVINETNQMEMIFDEARREYEEQADGAIFENFNPIVTMAVGTGLVIWIVQASQVAAVLLSTASAWVQLDPLTVIQGVGSVEEPATAEEKLFESQPVKSGD
jgi:hypothetical protein